MALILSFSVPSGTQIHFCNIKFRTLCFNLTAELIEVIQLTISVYFAVQKTGMTSLHFLNIFCFKALTKCII